MVARLFIYFHTLPYFILSLLFKWLNEKFKEYKVYIVFCADIGKIRPYFTLWSPIWFSVIVWTLYNRWYVQSLWQFKTLPQRLNKCSIFRLSVTNLFMEAIFPQHGLWSILGFSSGKWNDTLRKWLLWRVHHRTVHTEIHKVFSNHLAHTYISHSDLVETKAERCKCSAKNHTVNGKFRSQVFKLLFIYLFTDFSFTHYFIYPVHICWTTVICQGLC